MHLFVGFGVSVIGAGAFLLAACGGESPSETCQSVHILGVVIPVPAIDVMLRDAAGHGLALGATVTAINADLTVFNSSVWHGSDTLHVYFDVVAEGTYEVHVSKPSYRDTTVSGVVVSMGDCGHVAQTKVPITLALATGAPPVRSVAVLGASFLAAPGSQTRLTALVDADARVSTAVRWQLSDSTLARVDQSGVVTAKCSFRGGSETATATSVVDSTVHGTVTFGVGATASCGEGNVSR